jgi:hypothetical protein
MSGAGMSMTPRQLIAPRVSAGFEGSFWILSAAGISIKNIEVKTEFHRRLVFKQVSKKNFVKG